MEIITERITVATRGNSDVVNLTDRIAAFIRAHRLQTGNVMIFVSGSTASVSTTEYEPGLIKDIPEAMDRIAPRSHRYHHDDTWHDGNGHAHVRATVLGPSLTVPFDGGELLLGTWQQIILLDFDTRPRSREVVIQAIGK